MFVFHTLFVERAELSHKAKEQRSGTSQAPAIQGFLPACSLPLLEHGPQEMEMGSSVSMAH